MVGLFSTSLSEYDPVALFLEVVVSPVEVIDENVTHEQHDFLERRAWQKYFKKKYHHSAQKYGPYKKYYILLWK